MLKLLPNFLKEDQFNKIQTYFFNKLEWIYNDSIAGENPSLDNFQFTHTFFDISNPSLQNYSSFLQPLLLKLKPQYIFRIKANLRPRTTQGVLSDYHVDMSLNQQTAIYYLNTNNGYTKFQDNTLEDVPSVANRLLTFYGGLKHCGCSATDSNYRIVLNINYIPSTLNL